MSHLQKYRIGWGIAIAILVFSYPFLVPEIKVHLAIEALIYALFAISFNLLFGYAGIVPFGHAALFGIGAYGAALIFNYFPGIPLLLTLLIAAFAGFIAGAFIGFFCVRLKGAYSSLLSFAFQMFVFAVALKWRSLTGGDDGIGVTLPDLHLPVLGIVSMKSASNLYFLILTVVFIGILACYLFLKTPFGNSIVCTRENDMRASFLGYNVFMTRLVAFSVSGLLAGLAGGLFILLQKFVVTSVVGLDMSLNVVLMTVIGGSGNFLGPVLGAIIYVLFQDWVSSLTKHWWIFMGIFFIVVILYFEGGLISLFKSETIRGLVNRRKEYK